MSIGVGVEVGTWRLEQNHETKELTLYKSGKKVYNGEGEKIYSLSELEEQIFILSKEAGKNGVSIEDMG